MYLLILVCILGAVGFMLGAAAGDVVTMIGAGLAIAAAFAFAAWQYILEPHLEARRRRRLALQEQVRTCGRHGGSDRLLELLTGELDTELLHPTLQHLDECEACAASFRVMVVLRAGREDALQLLTAARRAEGSSLGLM